MEVYESHVIGNTEEFVVEPRFPLGTRGELSDGTPCIYVQMVEVDNEV